MLRTLLIVVALVGAVAVGKGGVALAAGVGATCGGIAGLQCDGKLWCDPDPGQCGGADIAGKCVNVPEVCTEIYKPVCGCDNKTYGNDCERQRAKVAKKSEGKCKEDYK
ncbi:MAG: Kazal domain-containing protein [Methylocystis sp.]|nr:Kazal domain-containing protein [Methylocystis sp.]